jgi:hypothetical protein
MNIKDIKIFLQKYYSDLPNLNDLSEIILTIDENFKNRKISLLNLSNNLKINDVLNFINVRFLLSQKLLLIPIGSV